MEREFFKDFIDDVVVGIDSSIGAKPKLRLTDVYQEQLQWVDLTRFAEDFLTDYDFDVLWAVADFDNTLNEDAKSLTSQFNMLHRLLQDPDTE